MKNSILILLFIEITVLFFGSYFVHDLNVKNEITSLSDIDSIDDFTEDFKINMNENIKKSSFAFTENKGQYESIDQSIDYFISSTNFVIKFSENGILYQKFNDITSQAKLVFEGSNLVEPKSIDQSMVKPLKNYFIGSDPADWIYGISSYQQIIYSNLYDNIDLIYIANENGIKYEFHVYPGGNPNDIILKWEGSTIINMDDKGMEVRFDNETGFIDTNPIIFEQAIGGKQIEGSFNMISENQYGFDIAEYDRSRLLIIDPFILEFSTYVSGSDSEWMTDITVDATGNIFVVGITRSIDFPTTTGAYNRTLGLSGDLVVYKMSPDGSTLLFSTFIGGDDGEEASGIAIGTDNNIYIGGSSYSSNFPTTVGAYNRTTDNNIWKADLVILKLSSDGSSLLYSTLISGNLDDRSTTLYLDDQDNVYLAGYTDSTNFPMVNAYDTIGDANNDGFVLKFSISSSQLIFSSYFGGSDDDTINSLSLDTSGNIIIAGTTFSNDLPTLNAINSTGDADTSKSDGFLSIITSAGVLIYSTYLSGSQSDIIYAIVTDTTGIYLVGSSDSPNFPTKNAFNPNGPTDATYDVVIMKLYYNGSIAYSTYVGGSGSEYGMGIDVFNNMAYVILTSYSIDFPMVNAYNAVGDGSTNADAVMLRMNPTGTNLTHSTYIGGSFYDYANKIKVQQSGSFIVAGSTQSTDFPASNAYNSTGDGFTYRADQFLQKYQSLDYASDNVNPVVDSPNDLIINEGEVGRNITWHPSDTSPQSYNITLNGTLYQSGSWDGSNIVINLDNLSIGQYIFVLNLYDSSNNQVSDTVVLTINDAKLPEITKIGYIEIFEGSNGNTVYWNVSDLHPGTYQIYVDNILVKSDTWTTGQVSYNFDSMTLGVHHINITITDSSGNTNSNGFILVVLDVIAPSISSAEDRIFDASTNGNLISWTVSDNHPATYSVSIDGKLIIDNAHWSNGVLEVYLDGMDAGNYEIVITLTDTSGNIASDTVLITINGYNTNPELKTVTFTSTVYSTVTVDIPQTTTESSSEATSKKSIVSPYMIILSILSSIIILHLKGGRRNE